LPETLILLGSASESNVTAYEVAYGCHANLIARNVFIGLLGLPRSAFFSRVVTHSVGLLCSREVVCIPDFRKPENVINLDALARFAATPSLERNGQLGLRHHATSDEIFANPGILLTLLLQESCSDGEARRALEKELLATQTA
jgi:hypothetical protein